MPDRDDDQLADIGLTGLAVMGQNLARNIARHGYPIVVHNRTKATTDAFINGLEGDDPLFAADAIEDFVSRLKKPRKIILMVKAGDPVDAVLDELLPLLDEGDIVIDGGNSFFQHTERRQAAVQRGRHQLPRRRHLRRRGGRAQRAQHHAGRRSRRVRAGRGHPHVDLGARGRRAVLPLDRSRRRRSLREDGPQRHRVRRHPADRRVLRPHAPRPRTVGGRAGEGLRTVERGRPRVVPHRDHQHRPGQAGSRYRPAPRRRHPRPGGAEGHRSLDRAGRPGARRPLTEHDDGGLRPLAVRTQGEAGAGVVTAERPGPHIGSHCRRSDID